ncbi:very-long-chain 3-oxoacyl-CoA reductase-B-like [Ascaphus truei]|uniref:very-long-chain 3-oxoacyl-CoA reductase-B-like n=1 Tax=Ascaphus truei TaxID=8439 RepID=UPI003F5915DF
MGAGEACLLSQGLALFGALALGFLVITQGWKVVRGVRSHIISQWWRTDFRQYGAWAVVTGATDGIGKAYAEELARRGLNIVLISRSLEKLQRVATGIEQQCGRKTRIIQADFTRGSEIYQPIEEALKDLDIGVLVNNVGMTYAEGLTEFLNVPDIQKRIADIINCNIMSVTQMTGIVLSKMMQRKKGVIINLSSEAGARPYAKITVYSATKAFVDFFSKGLHHEYKSKGIIVQCVMPLLVSTNMTQRIGINVFVKSSDSFARDALNTVGYESRTSGCLSHSLQSYAIPLLLPNSLLYSSVFSSLVSFLEHSTQERQPLAKAE